MSTAMVTGCTSGKQMEVPWTCLSLGHRQHKTGSESMCHLVIGSAREVAQDRQRKKRTDEVFTTL